MNFRSVAQLSDLVLALSREIPQDIDVIVGVPRSGLLAANLLAMYRNLPLTDVEGLIAGRIFGSGLRGREPVDLSVPRRVLVVDDTANTGETNRQIRARIAAAGLQHEVRYAAVYVQPHRTNLVDYYGEVLNQPRVFEWNVLHHTAAGAFCVDLDGVLCVDPTPEENDDGEAYLEFLENAQPLYTPTTRIGWIVTSRLERYREQTEKWLARAGVEYGELFMMDYPDGVTRRRLFARTAYKAETYRRTGATLFVESSLQQSFEIANLSDRDVLCVETMQVVRPGSAPLARYMDGIDDVHPPSMTRRFARKALPQPVRTRLAGLIRT